MFRMLAALTIALTTLPSTAHAQRRVPTVDDLLNLKTVGGAQISPDGARVAYTVSEVDFKQDAFVTQVWLAEVATGRTIQLTRHQKSSTNPRWSPDGRWIAFASPRVNDRNQLFVISPDGGEAIQLTASETPVSNYTWSPDGKHIAFTAPEPQGQAQKDRKEHLGDFEVVRRDYQYVHVFTIGVEEALKSPSAGRQRTKGKDFSVGGMSWAPDGTRIAFSATINPDLVQGVTSDVYVLTLADDRVRNSVTIRVMIPRSTVRPHQCRTSSKRKRRH